MWNSWIIDKVIWIWLALKDCLLDKAIQIFRTQLPRPAFTCVIHHSNIPLPPHTDAYSNDFPTDYSCLELRDYSPRFQFLPNVSSFSLSTHFCSAKNEVNIFKWARSIRMISGTLVASLQADPSPVLKFENETIDQKTSGSWMALRWLTCCPSWCRCTLFNSLML